MTFPFWRRMVVPIALALVLAGVAGALGCAQAGGGANGTDDEANVPFAVETSQLFITVANRSSRALLDVQVQVVPVGRATIFTTSHPRFEPGERRNFAVGSLRGRDGTPLNLRITKPRTVIVTAKDPDGTEYKLERGWR